MCSCISPSLHGSVLCMPPYFLAPNSLTHQFHPHIYSNSLCNAVRPTGFLFDMISMRYQLLRREILQLKLLIMIPVALPFLRSQFCILHIVSLCYQNIWSAKMHLTESFHGKAKYWFDMIILMGIWKQWLRMSKIANTPSKMCQGAKWSV